MKKQTIMAVCLLTSTFSAESQIITTIAGTGIGSSTTGDNGQATAAQVPSPYGIAADPSGNIYFTSDNRIRKVSTTGIITTVVGDGTFGFFGDGGPATAAQMGSPTSIAFDGSGNMYIADGNNNRIRKVTTAGIISTIAGDGTAAYFGDGGPATSAELNLPHQLAVDATGNVYVADWFNQRIRKIDALGMISTVAGGGASALGDGGPATAATLNNPVSLAIDGAGTLYIGDAGNYRIRKVSAGGIITTIAGNGTAGYGGDGGAATLAELNNDMGALAIDAAGNLYVPDGDNRRVRKIDAAGMITSIAGDGTYGFFGDGGPATSAQLALPAGIALDGFGNVYITDPFNYRVRKITYATVPTSVESVLSPALTVTPNPSYSGHFSINAPLSNSQKMHIAVTDAVGRSLKEIDGVTGSPMDIYLDVPPGVYFLACTTENERWFAKLVR